MPSRTVILALVAGALSANLTLAQSDQPRNDLPQPYRTTRTWGELPAGLMWAAVTAVEPAPDGTIYVIHRCSANSCADRMEPPILKYDANKKGIRIGSARDGKVVAFIEDSESTVADHSGAEGVGVDAQGNVYGAVVRRRMLERHIK